jgi:hypothetical protein
MTCKFASNHAKGAVMRCNLMILSVIFLQPLHAVPACDDAPEAERTPPEMRDVLTADVVHRDLDRLQEFIDREWLLSNVNNAEYHTAIRGVRESAVEGMTAAELTMDHQRILSMGADGHTHVSSLFSALGSQGEHYPPFAVEPIGDRYVAVVPTTKQRDQLWSRDFPYIVAIDGIAIERWVQTARPYVSHSHELAMRAKAAALLRYLPYFRKQLSLDDVAEFDVTLQSSDGVQKQVTAAARSMPLGILSHSNSFNYFVRGERQWEILADGIGYLWLRSSTAPKVRLVAEALPAFRATRGLIIDLRMNAGGTPEIMAMLGIWLTSSDTPRVVAGIDRRDANDCVPSTWGAYDANSPAVTVEGQNLISQALGDFTTAWTAPTCVRTRDRCVLLASPRFESGIAPFHFPRFTDLVPDEAVYEYRQPIVVIVDRHCASSAEITAAGLQQFPQVKVLGEPTFGAGGSPTPLTLPSGLKFMATRDNVFMSAQGELIDGRGVQPDIAVPLDLETLSGPTDTMLQRAIAHLGEFARP